MSRLQTMLGHASAVLTMDTSSDLFPDDLEAVAARLDEAVRKQGVGFDVGADRKSLVQDSGRGL
jgi:hypothetical protein